jgi:5-methylcytosine-specific restriction endonuclease McrA
MKTRQTEKERKAQRQACTAKWKKANPDKVKVASRAYRKANREKTNAANSAWRRTNPDKGRATTAAWREKNKKRVKELQSIRSAKYYALNRKKMISGSANYHAEHPEQVKATRSRWKKKHPEKVRIAYHNYQATKKENGGKISLGLAEKLLTRQKNHCAVCKKSLSKTGYHLDHIVPLARGGKNEDRNMQATCPKCNMEKNAKDPIAFMRSRGFLL